MADLWNTYKKNLVGEPAGSCIQQTTSIPISKTAQRYKKRTRGGNGKKKDFISNI